MGVPSPKDIAKAAKEKGMTAVGLTDFSGLYGSLEFYLACKDQGIKAILGSEMYIAPRSLHKKETRSDGRPHNMLFLAETNEGYKNLTRLCTIAHIEGMYYKPRIDYEVIEQNKKGLIAIDSGRYTKLANLILENGSEKEIDELIKKHLEIFGKDNYFFGLLDYKNTPAQLELNEKLKELGKKYGIGLVALQNSFYINPEDNEAQDVVTCIAIGRDIDDGGRFTMIDEDYSFRDTEDIEQIFEDVPEAIENTAKIAERCNVDFDTSTYRIPDFHPSDEEKEKYSISTPLELFRVFCIEGLKIRYPQFTEHLKSINWREWVDLGKSTIDKKEISLEIKADRSDDGIDLGYEPDFISLPVSFSDNSHHPQPLSQGERGVGFEKEKTPHYITELAREFRKNPTNFEDFLWQILRNRQFDNLKFRRQHPIGRYIADFYCDEIRLVIELDGKIHENQKEYDEIRDEIISNQGINILRIKNEELEEDLEGVLFRILEFKLSSISERVREAPSPSGRGLGGGQENKNKTFSGQHIAIRFEHEFKIIQRMGFESYFLMVSDYCIWSKENGILVGPGRGSGAGSIIAYAMKITNLEPLKYGLLFERFLNPERVSMPDFDIDFEDERRDEVIDYVTKKYGQDHVAQICTFGTMAARAAVKDVGRTYGISFGEMNEFAKLIPEKPGTTLDEAWESEADLREKVNSEEKFKKVWEVANLLEGNVRHISVHACAVVIADRPLENYTALQHPPKDDTTTITQYSAKPLEKLGLLKMDFLGLKNLSILKHAINVIKKTTGDDIDLDNLPIDDKKTYELFQRGETTGVFQFESPGMKRYLKELLPTRFEDLIAMNSLYRPGPMEFIPNYIKGKHHPSTVKYPHESLKAILEETYGIAVYQEQILQIAQIFSGYSLGEADMLRRAIGKKIAEEMDKQRNNFIEGAKKLGNDEKLAKHIFDDIVVPFAGYGFNKSHAAAYSMVAYLTAYLKAHYPTQFMAALLIADQGNTDRIAIEIKECLEIGVDVLPPDVNESDHDFTVVGEGKIRFGLSAIKNLGDAGIEEIASERNENGKFENITDFITRIEPTHLNKKNFEALIKSGALDSMVERNSALESMMEMIDFAKEKKKSADTGQMDLFAMMGGGGEGDMSDDFELKQIKEATIEERLEWEKEFLGLFVSMHPLAGLENFVNARTFDLSTLTKKDIEKGKVGKLCGLIEDLRIIRTKKGDNFAVFKLETPQGKIDTAVFPKYYDTQKNKIREGTVVLIEGKLQIRQGALQISGEKIIKMNIEELRKQAEEQKVLGKNTHLKIEEKKIPALFDKELKEWKIKIPYGAQKHHTEQLKELLIKNPGETIVTIILPGAEKKEIQFPKGVDANGTLRAEVTALLTIN